jgi:hypothetical protein
MLGDVALGALGGVGKLALYFKTAAKTKEKNLLAISRLIEENNLFISYMLSIEDAIKTRAGEGQIPSYKPSLIFLEKCKTFLDDYHGKNSKLLNAKEYEDKIKVLLGEMKDLRERLYQDLDLFYKNNPPVQQSPTLPTTTPAAEQPEVVQSGYATVFLYKNYPHLAKIRDESKHFKKNPSEPLFQIAISLLEGKEYAQAIIWLERADTPKAHFNLGRIYRKGEEFGVKRDLKLAFDYHEKACEQTTDFQAAACSALELGLLYANPEFEKYDLETAKDIWTKLAEDKDVVDKIQNVSDSAQRNLKMLESQSASSSRPSRQ